MTKQSLPISPSPDVFSKHRVLLSSFNCWVAARGSNMLPTTDAFFDNLLNFPEVVPQLVTIGLEEAGPITYQFSGSEVVNRRDQEISGQNMQSRYDPLAWDLIQKWILAIQTQPVLTYTKSKSRLLGDKVDNAATLSTVLSNESGAPSALALVTVHDTDLTLEGPQSQYKSGSLGIEFIPLDIGHGIPDLPRSVRPSRR